MSKQWRLNHLYKIIDKNKKLITFKEKDVQKKFNTQAHTRNIILKSRQHGFTTNACIDGLDDALFNKNFKFTIIADTLDHAIEIFEKIKIAWDNFPLKDCFNVNSETTRQYIFNPKGSDSVSTVRVTTSARSATVNRLHISEFGNIAEREPKKAKEIITGSIPAVPKNGRVDIESTAKGERGLFYDLAIQAMNNEIKSKLSFKFHFFGWLDDKDCQLEGDIDISEKLREYQKLHNISDLQINWYAEQSKILGDEIKQEYPTFAEEAFMFSGEKLFDQNILTEMMQETVEGSKEGCWEYFEKYQIGHRYALGADVSEGIGQDSNTIAIFDFTPVKPKIVATYVNNRIAPDLFAYEIKNGAEKYGMALAGVERNNPGHATLTELKKIYPIHNIFREKKEISINNPKDTRLGWNTTATSKPKMMYDLRRAVYDKLIEIPSRKIISEMRTYDVRDLNIIRFDEEQTQHWDLLMATAIGYQMKSYLYNTDTDSTYYPSFLK